MYVKDFFALAASVMTRYEGLKDYKKGDRVIYDGKVYECTENHVSDVKGDLQEESQIVYWELLIGKVDILNEWEVNILYSVDDFVVYEDDIYTCIEKHRSTEFFNVDKWKKVLVGGEIYQWQPNTFYLLDKKVSYNNSLYQCVEQHTSSESFEDDAELKVWEVAVSGAPNVPLVSTKVGIAEGDIFRDENGVIYLAKKEHTEDELEYTPEKDVNIQTSEPVFTVAGDSVYNLLLSYFIGKNGKYLVKLDSICAGTEVPGQTVEHASNGEWFVDGYANSSDENTLKSLFLVAKPGKDGDNSVYVARYEDGEGWTQTWTPLGGGVVREWEVGVSYKKNDLVTFSTNEAYAQKTILLCTTDHTSDNYIYPSYWQEIVSGIKNVSGCDARQFILNDMIAQGYTAQFRVRYYYLNMSCSGLPNTQGVVGYMCTVKLFQNTNLSLTASPCYSSNHGSYGEAFLGVEYHCSYNSTDGWSAWIANRPAKKFTFSGVAARTKMLQVMAQLGSTTTADFYFLGSSTELPSSNYEWHVTCHYRSATYVSFVAYAVTRNTTMAQSTIYYGNVYNGTWKGWYTLSDFLGWEWRRRVMPNYNSNLDYDDWRIHISQVPAYKGAVPSSVFPAIGVNICQEFASSETSGIHFDTDSIVIWSPGDGDAIMRLYDEDQNNTNSIASVDSGTGQWHYRSDRRCKENIDYTPYEDILEKIDMCQPCHFNAKNSDSLADANYTIQALDVAGDVLYEYLDEERKEKYTDVDEYVEKEIAAQERRIARLEKKQAVRQYGIIAQEVEDIFPECVFIDKNGYYSVQYDKFGLYAIEGVKALHQKVKDLEVEKETLQAKNEELELRLAAIEAKLGL